MIPDNRQSRARRARHALAALIALALLLALLPIPAQAAGSPAPATEESAPGPSGATTFAGVTYLYARRGDGAVWVRKTDGLWYSGWSPLGGATDTAPAAASSASFVSVFVRGQDGKLWANHTRDGLNYDGWQPLGEPLASPPAAAGIGGRVHVFTRDARGMIWERITADGRTFSAATPIGGPIAAAPVAANLGGVLTLYGTDADGRLYTTSTRDGERAEDWGTWQPRGGTAAQPQIAGDPGDGMTAPLTLDFGVNFISAGNWQNYQIPAYSRLRPTLAKFSLFYDAYPTTPAFGTREIDDVIALGARTIIFRTAETRIAPDEVDQQLNAPLPGDGRSVLAYIRDQAAAGSGVDFWIEVGNEPDLAGVSPLVARYALLATIRDLKPKYPELRWIASLPTKQGLPSSTLPDYRGLAYLDLLLSDQDDGLGSVAARYDALGVHLYGADTLEQSYPALHQASDTLDCGGTNGDALCPDAILDRVLSRTDNPIFITEAGINSAMPWNLKVKYYVDAIYRLPARVRGFALFTLSLDPEWYAGDGDRCPKPAGLGCSRYALDVDEQGVLDTSFAGASAIGQCYQAPPAAASAQTLAGTTCAPPCRLTTTTPSPRRPRSAIPRAPCAVDAATPPGIAPSVMISLDRELLPSGSRVTRRRRRRSRDGGR